MTIYAGKEHKKVHISATREARERKAKMDKVISHCMLNFDQSLSCTSTDIIHAYKQADETDARVLSIGLACTISQHPERGSPFKPCGEGTILYGAGGYG